MAAGISTAFAQLLTTGYQMVARLEVLDANGAVILDSASSTVLNVVGGSITVDGSASFRRVISDLAVVDPTGSLVPTSKTAYFSPAANNELRLSVGAIVNGTPEYVPQGRFHLEGAKVEDTAAGQTVTLSAYDRARKYARSKRVTPRKFLASGDPTWPGGWPIVQAITTLLQDAYPGTYVNSDNPATLLPEQLVDTGADPWEAARQFGDAMGYELYFDRYGDCRLTRVTDPNSASLTASWTYAEGANSGLLGVVRNQSNEGVYNGCVVTGETPSNGAAVKSDIAWDTDPNSPTYYLGPYGKIVELIQSDKVRTVQQANDMARARVNANKGLVEAVEFTIVPNPAIDPGDAIKLTRVRSGFPTSGPGSEAVVVDRYSISLTAAGGAMTVGCRQRRLS